MMKEILKMKKTLKCKCCEMELNKEELKANRTLYNLFLLRYEITKIKELN